MLSESPFGKPVPVYRNSNDLMPNSIEYKGPICFSIKTLFHIALSLLLSSAGHSIVRRLSLTEKYPWILTGRLIDPGRGRKQKARPSWSMVLSDQESGRDSNLSLSSRTHVATPFVVHSSTTRLDTLRLQGNGVAIPTHGVLLCFLLISIISWSLEPTILTINQWWAVLHDVSCDCLYSLQTSVLMLMA